jgi:hypothetical protein
MLSFYLSILAMLFHICHIDLSEFALSVYIILINIHGASATEPARRAVLAASPAIK